MLSRLYKDEVSGGGGCPSVYAEDGAGAFVVVGDQVGQDPAVAVGLTDLLPGEVAVRIPEEVLLGAAEGARRPTRTARCDRNRAAHPGMGRAAPGL
jgi:hypothetical protein